MTSVGERLEYWRRETEALEAKLHAVEKLRDEYASQARFADHEPAAYFREFVSRINKALKPPVVVPQPVAWPAT